MRRQESKVSNGNILQENYRGDNKNPNKRMAFSKEYVYKQTEFHFFFCVVSRPATLFNSRATTIFVHNQITSANCKAFFFLLSVKCTFNAYTQAFIQRHKDQ